MADSATVAKSTVTGSVATEANVISTSTVTSLPVDSSIVASFTLRAGTGPSSFNTVTDARLSANTKPSEGLVSVTLKVSSNSAIPSPRISTEKEAVV